MSERPYAPSWLDRITDAVARIPVPYPVVYLVIGLLLAFGRTVIAWNDGSYPVGTFFAVHVLDGLIPMYFLFAIHLLDQLSRRAMSDYRPRLKDNGEYEQLTHRLTTMPFRSGLVVGILGLIEGAIYIQVFLSPVDIERSHYLTSPVSIVADTVLSALSGLFMVMFVFHTIRQLWLVSRIYTRHTNVSIFDIGGLYALSRVTAVSSITLLFFTYVYFALYTNGTINSLSNGVVVAVIVIVALLTFIVPLWGAHRLLQTAKSRRLSDVAHRLEAASDTLHGRVDTVTYTDEVDHIGNAIDSLMKEREVVAKGKTWPWEPDAVRAVLTAVILPILIWIVTRILERFGV